MIPLLGGRPRSILLLGAHSDDIEIGCGGTVLTLLARFPDLRVHWVVLSGAGERAGEARAGAGAFLADAQEPRVEVADFPDTAFPYEGATGLKAFFRELGRTCEPDLVFTHRRDDAHQDHRFVAELTWQTFRDHVILEYEIPKYEGDLGRPDTFVPLDRAVLDRKADAIVRTFASQAAKPWFSRETITALARIRGNECRAGSGVAEGFHCAKMVLV